MLQAPVSSKVEAGTPVDFNLCMENFFAEHLIEGVECAHCGKKTNFTDTKRFVDYPTNLVIILQRFVFDDWTPKKLEIDFKVDPNNEHNFDKFRGNNCKLAPGEEAMPEAQQAAEVEPDLNMEMVNQLLMMGVPENPAKHAVYQTQ